MKFEDTDASTINLRDASPEDAISLMSDSFDKFASASRKTVRDLALPGWVMTTTTGDVGIRTELEPKQMMFDEYKESLGKYLIKTLPDDVTRITLFCPENVSTDSIPDHLRTEIWGDKPPEVAATVVLAVIEIDGSCNAVSYPVDIKNGLAAGLIRKNVMSDEFKEKSLRAPSWLMPVLERPKPLSMRN